MSVHQIISGCELLPEGEQHSLRSMLDTLTKTFGPTRDLNRPPNEVAAIRQIEDGILLLLKHCAAGLLSRDRLARKMALVRQAAEELHPEFLAKFQVR